MYSDLTIILWKVFEIECNICKLENVYKLKILRVFLKSFDMCYLSEGSLRNNFSTSA